MPYPLTYASIAATCTSWLLLGTGEFLRILLSCLTPVRIHGSRGEARSGPGAASLSLGAWPDVTLWLTRSCTIHPRGRGVFLILLCCLFTFVPRLGNSHGSSAQLWPRSCRYRYQRDRFLTCIRTSSVRSEGCLFMFPIRNNRMSHRLDVYLRAPLTDSFPLLWFIKFLFYVL